MKTLLLKLFFYLLLFLLFLFAFYLFSPLHKTAKTVYFPSSDRESITEVLEENGYTVRWPDRLVMAYADLPTEGWYTVGCQECSRVDFFATLHTQKAKTMEVVVYAGETAQELSSRLANDMKLDAEKLLEYYQTRTLFQEADIFAGRYILARDADENTTMAYLFDLSRKNLVSYAVKHFKEIPELSELKVLLTMASIIQKESNSKNEMALISSVIYNRLEKDMKLQMDSTLNYGKYSHTIVTPERLKTDNSFYNTYKYKGLPLYPLSTVTLDALYAAKYPAEGDYLFFMLSPKQGHNFSATYVEHLENIRIFRKHQKEKEEKKKREAQEKMCLDENASLMEKRIN